MPDTRNPMDGMSDARLLTYIIELQKASHREEGAARDAILHNLGEAYKRATEERNLVVPDPLERPTHPDTADSE